MTVNYNKAAPRKGANGVLLKKFEANLQQMFSLPSSSTPSSRALDTLTPRYSVQPPRLSNVESDILIEKARTYWKAIGLEPNPKLSNNTENSSENTAPPWPFDRKTSLPSIGHVHHSQPNNPKAKTTKTKTGKDKGGVGDIQNSQRAWRKEAQLANLIHCVLALLPHRHSNTSSVENARRKIRIVDFAGGTGHLSVVLALLLPDSEVICVDLKKWSLDLLHRRVDGCLDELTENTKHVPNEVQATKTIPNLFTYFGSIQSFTQPFDIGVSLHACGEASDWVLRKCLEKKASFVVSSCCCGKISRNAANPYTFHSTGGNDNEIQYPQSKAFASLGKYCEGTSEYMQDTQQHMTPEMFDEIAKAADYSELGDLRKPRNACRRAAKSLVEWDRLLFAKESQASVGCNEGNVILTRMLPWESSTKNDILVGWHSYQLNPYSVHSDEESIKIPIDTSCDRDFHATLDYLFGISDLRQHQHDYLLSGSTLQGTTDWTVTEEEKVKHDIL